MIVIGSEREGEYLSSLQRGVSPIVENSGKSLASKVLTEACPNCGVRLLSDGLEKFCPNCMMIVAVESGVARVTGSVHKPNKPRSNEENEMQVLLRSALERGNLKLVHDSRLAAGLSDIVVICVGTPVDSERKPDLAALVSATVEVGRGLRRGALVILKSTVSPGTTEGTLAPILERESGLRVGKDFGLAHVPETTLEGLALLGYRTLPKTVGGIDEKSSKAAAEVFGLFNVPIHIFNSPRVTEAAKLFQNIYRDVNIALANELALASESLGLDVSRVIEASLTEPKTHLLTPGPGVGGYCLPKDTYYLTFPAQKAGFRPRLLSSARTVNDGMPLHVVGLVKSAYSELRKRTAGSTVCVLGVAFKGNTSDTRDSPSLPVIRGLLRLGMRVRVQDPLADLDSIPVLRRTSLRSKTLRLAMEGAESLLVLTDHLEYRSLAASDLPRLGRKLRIVVDTRGLFEPSEVTKLGLVYRGVGRSP